MPDMVFPNNILTLKHQDGASMQFNALDALRTVSNGKINIQLACAEAWKESRYRYVYSNVFTLFINIFSSSSSNTCMYIYYSIDQKAVNIWKKK